MYILLKKENYASDACLEQECQNLSLDSQKINNFIPNEHLI